MKSIEVKIPGIEERSYRVVIGSGLLGGIIADVKRTYPKHGLFVVTDSEVVRAGHFEKLGVSEGGARGYVIEPAGEISKHIGTVGAIIEAMEAAKLGRDTVILALGGGVVGDVAGFAASIFKRGVPVVQVPTTTVSQADSAIGGKTGVDSSISKNAFGTFWNPFAVYVDVATLKTLDERQFRAGLVESVKHALIMDAGYFEFIEQNLDKVLVREQGVLEEIAERNCRIKAGVVEKDPYEKNIRCILNYGHTIGHAVESASDYEILHGEAVGIGIIAAGLIEKQLGLVKSDRLERVRNVLKTLDIGIKMPENMDNARVFELLRSDKKSVGKVPRFVLLEEIGCVRSLGGQYAVEVGDQVIKTVLDEL